jgi:hypothetical protein
MKLLKWVNILAMVTFTAAVLVIPKAASAQGDPVNCSGPLPPGTYDNVNALAGCVTGPGVHITGNLTVLQGGSLFDAATTIDGNLQARQALWIEIGGIGPPPTGSGHIGGNLEVIGTTSSPAPGINNQLCNTYIGGNVEVHNNSASSPFDIGGPSNECTAGPLLITSNLEVHDNAATVNMVPSGTGSGNIAGNNIEVHNNVGGGSLMENHAGNNCELHSDQPPFSTAGNTAGHTNDCTSPD